MKKLRLANNIEANTTHIKSLVGRIRFMPDQNTLLKVPAIVLKRIEFSIKCLQKIDMAALQDKDTKIEMFSNPLKNRVLSKVHNGFTDTSTVGIIIDAKTCGAMKTINPNEYLQTKKDIIDATELLVGIDIVRRKSMIFSSTSLVSKNKNDTHVNVPHIEIAIWDGYLNSPNSYIIYIEKFIDKYRFIYLEKTAVDIDRFKYSIYNFDCNSKLLDISKHKSVSVEDDILLILSSQKSLYQREEMFNELFDIYGLLPSSKKNTLEDKSNDKTTENNRHIISKKRVSKDKEKKVQ